jgi:hypothetical protein
MKDAHGPRSHAVLVGNDRIALTYRVRKTWIGLTVNFKDGTIKRERIATRTAAEDYLRPGEGPRGRVTIGSDRTDLEDFI